MVVKEEEKEEGEREGNIQKIPINFICKTNGQDYISSLRVAKMLSSLWKRILKSISFVLPKMNFFQQH